MSADDKGLNKFHLKFYVQPIDKLNKEDEDSTA